MTSKSIPSLTIIDRRTNETYEIPITHNGSAIPAASFAAIKDQSSTSSRGLLCYDPGLRNTAVVETKVQYMNGKTGTLRYRDYDIRELFRRDLQYEDSAYLFVWGTLPSSAQKASFRASLNAGLMETQATMQNVISCFPREAPPMTIILAALNAYNSSQPQTIPATSHRNIYDPASNPSYLNEIEAAIPRTLAALAVAVAQTHRHCSALPTSSIRLQLDPQRPFLANMTRLLNLQLPRRKAKALERALLLYADHGMSNATFVFLNAASARGDPVTSLVAALASGWGALHGGATEMVWGMLEGVRVRTEELELGKGTRQIGEQNIRGQGRWREGVQELIEKVKRGEDRLWGFGHRVYESGDPRAHLMKEVLDEFDFSDNALFQIATEVERVASADALFKAKGVAMNVDLWGGFVFVGLGLPPEMILPLAAIARAQGYMARWREFMIRNPPIFRPQQLYTGPVPTSDNAKAKL